MQTFLQQMPRLWLVLLCSVAGCAISAMSEDDSLEELAYVADAGKAFEGSLSDAAASQGIVTDAAQTTGSGLWDAAASAVADAALASGLDASSTADAAVTPRDGAIGDASGSLDSSTPSDAGTGSDAGSKDAGVKDAGTQDAGGANMCVAASCSCGLLKPCCNASNQCACQDLLGLCILPAL
jgi:hypothetical protein